MIDLQNVLIELQTRGIIKGVRPVFIDIQKGDYPYKGKYVMTIDNDVLRFIQLNFLFRYKGKRANDFYIELANLKGYHYSYYKEFAKKINFYFSDGLDFCVTFPYGREEAFGNEKNATEVMNYLKAHGVKNQNLIVSGEKRGQKVISKADQWFTKEIRCPEKRKGLFF